MKFDKTKTATVPKLSSMVLPVLLQEGKKKKIKVLSDDFTL